ncbi:3-oxoadipate enol-lactonase [Rubellimicrobium aerolatum]|uniref:3-oxoadipate enol-lactonase n=1 Tax=Rubellimicrobium aerolatum TaxID=490979 RepID=A0ABW0S8L7_9RHOB|nr:3-oxoadipate enol-lactonase [Rubellimicrobium aerolatum]MBP1804194.1 3-oxoadipate enol-lactonase [Rubellimicrobium aerolatum]
MQVLERPWGRMHVRVEGDGPLVLLANSLGTDLRLWDDLLPLLPPGLRVARFDKRGHGLSDLGGAVTVEDLADDAVALIESQGGPAVVMGVSIGGMIAQALALRRPDLVRALVLSNTAARLGTPDSWAARIAQVEGQGLAAISDGIMERWFAPAFRATPQLASWRNMLARTSPDGYVACCRALARADLTADAPALSCPVLMIAGTQDGASPREVVEATARLIPNARLAVLDAGHLPMAETPEAFAAAVSPFLKEHAHA